MKKILIPTDFSICAEAATEVAMEIARIFKAHVYFLHISDDPMVTHHVPVVATTLTLVSDPAIVRARRKLNELVTLAEGIGVLATPVLVLNKGNDHIEDYVRPYEIDWIIMGSHGATGIREVVMGSRAERVVKHSPVPLLVIKKRPKRIDFKNIVFASTFESQELPSALGSVIEFAKTFDAQIHLLYLNFLNRRVEAATAQETMNRLTRLFPWFAFTTSIVETNDAECGIDEFVLEMGGDLIAVMSCDYEGKVKIMARRIATSLVNHEAIPVLVLNSK